MSSKKRKKLTSFLTTCKDAQFLHIFLEFFSICLESFQYAQKSCICLDFYLSAQIFFYSAQFTSLQIKSAHYNLVGVDLPSRKNQVVDLLGCTHLTFLRFDPLFLIQSHLQPSSLSSHTLKYGNSIGNLSSTLNLLHPLFYTLDICSSTIFFYLPYYILIFKKKNIAKTT